MDYTHREEIANAITHGMGTVLGIVGLAVIVARATLTGDTTLIVGVSIFGATLILLYGASTVYHSVPIPAARPVLKAIDHSAIYLLIAGTYTPFTLSALPGAWGWSLFGVVWGLALIGVVFKIFTAGRFKYVSLGRYLGMGWVAVVATKHLLAVVPTGGVVMVVPGGVAYSLGVVF
ncbi:hypothetical protein GYB61_13355 [bacterium]|nr:hypothetical protein [bacterium]